MGTGGNLVAVVLMIYAYGVMYNIGQIYLQDPTGTMTPGIVRSSIGTLAIVAAIPTIIWPAVYVGLFEGVWAGVVVFLVTTIGGSVGAKLLGVTAWRGALMGIHFIVATVATFIGYWMSLTNLPS